MARVKTKGANKEVEVPATFVPLFWKHLDKRCGIVKEFYSRYRKLKADCNANTLMLDMLCQRAAFISIQLETLECKAGERGRIDFGSYAQGVNCLQGLLTKLGLKRRDQGEKVHLASYLKSRRA
jgi:hypothetical protein